MEHHRSPLRRWLLIIVAVVLALYYGARFATDILWFTEVGYLGVFLKLTVTQVILSVVAGVVAFWFPYWNLRRARRKVETDHTYIIGSKADDYIDKTMVEGHVDTGILVTSIVIGLIFLVGSLHKAMFILQWHYAEPFGVVDPLFGRDAGFYIFKLPLYEWVARSLTSLVLIVTLLTAAMYFYEGAVYLGRRSVRVLPHALGHLAILVTATLVLKAVSYYFTQFPLVANQHELFGGASYADVHGLIPMLRVAMVLCVLGAIAVQVLARMDTDVTRVGYVLAGIIAVIVIGKAAYPAVLQYVTVRPRQLTAERPYIESSIKYTREAYMLNQVQVRDYDIEDHLTAEDLAAHRDTIDSVRLWDHRPLLTTYGQEEQIAPYYAFTDIDLDRYRVDGRLRQVALGARELYVYGLPLQAQTWVNEHISYTHGYGVAMSPVNEAVGEGLPVYWWSGIPPRRGGGLPEGCMDLTRPAIYFGQYGWPERGTDGASARSSMPQAGRQTASTGAPPSVGMMAPSGGRGDAQPRLGYPEYVLTNTSSPEIDYPAGEVNVQTVYSGRAGVPIGGFFRKLLFAIRFKDPMLLLSSEVTADSKLIMNRHILQRANRIFPFIAYDTDPFIFIRDSGGLSWVADSYTYTQRYPYSAINELQPFVRANYARNSIKVVIDAYDGTVDFYQVDENDPITNTFGRIFPGLLKPGSEIPEDVVKHLRYPRDMFVWQTSALSLYHMQDPEVFYQQEDRWERAQEVFGTRQGGAPDPTSTATSGGTTGSTQWVREYMEPYFVLLPPEGRSEVDFMLILPLTRYRRPNMASWLSAYWDTQTGAGRMTLYRFPKDSSVYGPMQIESRIDKDPTISQALTLWSGHGSQVIRGNLLAVPLKKTILWVEPIYIQASAEAIPTLQRVVVVFGSKVGGELEKKAGVVMAESLTAALEQAFGKLEDSGPDTAPEPQEGAPRGVAEPPAEPEDLQEPQVAAPEEEAGADTQTMLRNLAELLQQRNEALEQEMETNRQLQELIERMGRSE